MDAFGKNLFLNSTLRKYQKAAKRNDPQVTKDLSKRFDMELVPQMVEDLKNGVMSEDVNLFLTMQLAKVQPLTKSQMTKSYLDNPRGRILYAFKTFGIKQVNFVLEEFKNDIKTAQENVRDGKSAPRQYTKAVRKM
jgi:hypothetical protein